MYSFRFQFRIVILVKFSFNFGVSQFLIYMFHDFQIWPFLSYSLDDFSVNLDLNFMTFDFVDSSSSLLSKSIKNPNFSPLFIIRFDLFSKDISKFPYFSFDLTLIHHYAS